MFGLTVLGMVHTLLALLALISGLTMLVRFGAITTGRGLFPVYAWTTGLTALTSLGIFRHGGFNIAHVLGVMTLVVLALAVLAGTRRSFGRLSPYVETLGFTTTLFFHFVPGITETFSRFPSGAPLFTGPEDPQLAKVLGVVFVVYAIGAAIQAWRLKTAPRAVHRPNLI